MPTSSLADWGLAAAMPVQPPAPCLQLTAALVATAAVWPEATFISPATRPLSRMTPLSMAKLLLLAKGEQAAAERARAVKRGLPARTAQARLAATLPVPGPPT